MAILYLIGTNLKMGDISSASLGVSCLGREMDMADLLHCGDGVATWGESYRAHTGLWALPFTNCAIMYDTPRHPYCEMPSSDKEP